MKKRISMIMVLLIVMITVLSACTEKTTQVEKPAEEVKPVENVEQPAENAEWDPSKYLIGFSQGWNGVEFTQKMRAGIEKTCAENGLELVSTDANDSAEKQIADIEDLITRGVDVLLVATYKPEAIGNAVQKALDADIPVVVLSTAVVGVDTYLLTSDAFAMGAMAGEYMLEKMGGEGEIIHITGKEGSTVNRLRSEGFLSVLEKYPNAKIVASQTCNYDRTLSLTAIEDLIKVHPNIKGVYCNNDDMALGVLQGLEEAGRVVKSDGTGDVVVVSVGDGINKEIYDRTEDGKVYSQRNPTFGKEGVEFAIKLLKGEEVERHTILSGEAITLENLDWMRAND